MMLRFLIIFFCAEIYASSSAMQVLHKKIELRKSELRSAHQLTLKEKALISLMRVHGIECTKFLNTPVDLIYFNYAHVAQCCREIEDYATIRYPDYVPKDPPAAAPLSMIVHQAYEKKRHDILRIIVEHYYATRQWPALCLLARGGYIEACKILLSLNYVNVNCVDHMLRTPLMNAALNGKADIVELLLKRKDIDILHQDRCNKNAQRLASEHRQNEIVIMLENASHNKKTKKIES